MVALVVTVSPASVMEDQRVVIFPGGATTTMYRADTAFWVGYGFEAERGSDSGLDDASARFELDVDGKPVSMRTEVHTEADVPVRKTNVAEFAAGLPVGWHDFTNRWYDGGRLVLSSRTSIQFVDR